MLQPSLGKEFFASLALPTLKVVPVIAGLIGGKQKLCGARDVVLTNACLINLPAASLSRTSVGKLLEGAASACLIFSKYCFTRDNSRNTACSLAWTPWTLR